MPTTDTSHTFTANAMGHEPFWNETPLRTYLFDAFSVLLPAGERFMMAVVGAAAQGLPANSALAEQSRSFIADEDTHQRAHSRYNERLEQEGFPVAALEQPIQASLQKLQATQTLRTQLAMAAAFEYLTMLVSKAALREGGLLCRNDSQQVRLWRWHCQEELDHQHVTNDLLRALHIPYHTRLFYFFVTSLLLAGDIIRHMHAFAKTDIARGRLAKRSLLRATASLLVTDGATFARIALGWAGFFLPLRASGRN